MKTTVKVLLTASTVLSAISSSVMAMEGGAGSRDGEKAPAKSVSHAAPVVECTDAWFSSGESIKRVQEITSKIALDGSLPPASRVPCCVWLADQAFVDGNLLNAGQMADLALNLAEGTKLLPMNRRFAMNIYSAMNRYTPLLFVDFHLDKLAVGFGAAHALRTILAHERGGLETRYRDLINVAMAEMTAGIFTSKNVSKFKEQSLQRDQDSLNIARPTGEGLLACDIVSSYYLTGMTDESAAEAFLAAITNKQLLPWIRQRAEKALEQMRAESRAPKAKAKDEAEKKDR